MNYQPLMTEQEYLSCLLSLVNSAMPHQIAVLNKFYQEHCLMGQDKALQDILKAATKLA